jgi:DNA-binding XRE family transcriptional regulator
LPPRRTVYYPVRLVTDVSIRSREDSPVTMPSLRAMRAARLLSIRELAQQAGVAPSTIYLIETGRVTPRTRVIRQLAAALGVEPAAVDEFRRPIERT